MTCEMAESDVISVSRCPSIDDLADAASHIGVLTYRVAQGEGPFLALSQPAKDMEIRSASLFPVPRSPAELFAPPPKYLREPLLNVSTDRLETYLDIFFPVLTFK